MLHEKASVSGAFFCAYPKEEGLTFFLRKIGFGHIIHAVDALAAFAGSVGNPYHFSRAFQVVGIYRPMNGLLGYAEAITDIIGIR